MSLEVAIQENTQAITTLIALLSQGVTLPAPNSAVDHLAQAPVADNSASDTAESASESDRPEVAAKKPAKSSDAISTTKAEGVSYDDAAKAVQELARLKGRDAAIAVLGQFKAKTLKDVAPNDYAAIIAACEAV